MPSSITSSGGGEATKKSKKLRPKSQDLICFEHCDKKIFALETPEQCPGCETPLSDCQFRFPPFTLPTPFSRARDYPCSIAIKPTKGTWLDDFRPGDNLHIAVTTSEGDVVEFDGKGLHANRADRWDRCLVVNLLSGQLVDSDMVQDPDWGEYWDWTLDATMRSTSPVWNAVSYDENHHNCFTFVLSFLRALRQRPFSEWAEDRVDFCRQFVLPKTKVAAKYIGLYRKLRDSEDGVLAVTLPARGQKKANSSSVEDHNERVSSNEQESRLKRTSSSSGEDEKNESLASSSLSPEGDENDDDAVPKNGAQVTETIRNAKKRESFSSSSASSSSRALSDEENDKEKKKNGHADRESREEKEESSEIEDF